MYQLSVQGYEFAEDEEYYSEAELKKAEEDMEKEKGQQQQQNYQQPSSKPPNNIVASLKDPHGAVKPTRSGSKEKPADYEDGWYQERIINIQELYVVNLHAILFNF